MRILFLSAWCPWPADNGSKLRIYHLLRGLARQHHVDLIHFAATALDPEHEQHLRDLCHDVSSLAEAPFTERTAGRALGALSLQPRWMASTFSPAMARLVRQRAASNHYDVVVAAELPMAPYALALEHTPKVLEGLELLTLFEQYAHERRPAWRLRYGLTWWKIKYYVSRLLRRFAGVTFAASADQTLVTSWVSASLHQAIIPNGVALGQYSGNFAAPEADVLVYPGALSYAANLDAVRYFLHEVFPTVKQARDSARLRVTGKVSREQIAALNGTEHVEFTGYLEDVRPAVAQAWAEVVPLRKGGGTRLKVLEALALGTPIISTPKGIEGLRLIHERDVLVADSAGGFAAQTVRLLASPRLRDELARNGRAAVARYEWSHSVQRLEELLMAACGQQRSQLA